MRLTVPCSRSELLAAIALDLALGDPPWCPHPVRGIGWLAKRNECFWRSTGLPLRWAGMWFWFTTIAATVVLVRLTTPRANVYWIYSFLACRDLDRQASAVMGLLESGNTALAREQLGRIVGRDTADLSNREIIRAVIETVAENASDGVVAPLFYLAIAGPSGMALYKAANTLDSIVGHKNSRYRDFGWWSARADDVLNLIPARLTALLVGCAAAVTGNGFAAAFRTALRDGASQPSPNAGYPEAAFAGALGVQLGGTSAYGGVPCSKPFLGIPRRDLDSWAFRGARRLLYGSSGLFALIILATMRRRS